MDDLAGTASRTASKYRSFLHCTAMLICTVTGSLTSLLLSALHVCLYRRLIISRCLTLHKGDSPGRTGWQTVAQAVAVIIPQKLRFSVYDADGSLMAGIGTDAAAVAFFLINVNHSSNHKTRPPDKNEYVNVLFRGSLIVQADYTIMNLINMLF